MNEEYMFSVANYLIGVANSLEESAALSGSMSDGGARALRGEIAAWRAGMGRCLPLSWERHKKEFDELCDPDYKRYQELKKRFGD